MSARNGKPCKKCGANDWNKRGNCKPCGYLATKSWIDRNKERVKSYPVSPETRQRNRDTSRLWREKYPDRQRAASNNWKAANREKYMQTHRDWDRRHPEVRATKDNVRRTRISAAGGKYTPQEWKELCDRYGNRCLRCGDTTAKLTFDHVIPVSAGGSSDISNGQPLCRSCNAKKGRGCADYRPDKGIA